jgi:hypothetical protein
MNSTPDGYNPVGLNPEGWTQPQLGFNPEWTQPQKGLNLEFLSASNETIFTPAIFIYTTIQNFKKRIKFFFVHKARYIFKK